MIDPDGTPLCLICGGHTTETSQPGIWLYQCCGITFWQDDSAGRLTAATMGVTRRLAEALRTARVERDEALAVLAAIGGALEAAGVDVPAVVQDYPRFVVALAIEREEARECIAGLRRLVEQLRLEAERTGWGEECSDLIAASEWGTP